jgi:hypothetical protein
MADLTWTELTETIPTEIAAKVGPNEKVLTATHGGHTLYRIVKVGGPVETKALGVVTT